MSKTGACDNVCETATAMVNCLPKYIGNGVCDDPCNIDECGWDGFDCIQLCKCNTTLLGNGICNPECNNAECDYDKYVLYIHYISRILYHI